MFAFKFSNLCGSVYRQGNVVFTPDGNSLLSPVGNRVMLFDLVNNTSSTLPFENTNNIHRLALSPDGSILISIDRDGKALLINFFRKVVLSHFNFKTKVSTISFSPNGKFFAVNSGHHVCVWRTPSLRKEFAPFILYRTIVGHSDDITSLDWSNDSQYLISGSKDQTARIHCMDPNRNILVPTLAAHRAFVLACYFDKNKNIV